MRGSLPRRCLQSAAPPHGATGMSVAVGTSTAALGTTGNSAHLPVVERIDLIERLVTVLDHPTLSNEFKMQCALTDLHGIRVDSFVRLLSDAFQDVAEWESDERRRLVPDGNLLLQPSSAASPNATWRTATVSGATVLEVSCGGWGGPAVGGASVNHHHSISLHRPSSIAQPPHSSNNSNSNNGPPPHSTASKHNNLPASTANSSMRPLADAAFDDPILYSVDALYDLKCEVFMAFAAVDTDGDGLVSWEDFIDFVLDTRASLLCDDAADGGGGIGKGPSHVVLDRVPYDPSPALGTIPLFAQHSAAVAASTSGANGGFSGSNSCSNNSSAARPPPSPAAAVSSRYSTGERYGGFRARVEARRREAKLGLAASAVGGGGVRKNPFLVKHTLNPYCHPIFSEELSFLRSVKHCSRFVGITKHSGAIVCYNSQLVPTGATMPAPPTRLPTGDGRAIFADITLQGNIVSAHEMRVVKLWGNPKGSLRPMRVPLLFEYACEDLITSMMALPSLPSSSDMGGGGFSSSSSSSSSLAGLVFTGESKGGIKVWSFAQSIMNEFRDGESIEALKHIHVDYYGSGDRHADAVMALHLDPMLHDRHLLSADASGVLCVNDIERQVLLRAYYQRNGGILGLGTTTAVGGGRLVAAVGFAPDPCLWDVTSRQGSPMLLHDAVHPHLGRVPFVTALGEGHGHGLAGGSGNTLMTCDVRSRCKVWDVRMMRCLNTIDLCPAKVGLSHMHTDAVLAAAPFWSCEDRVGFVTHGSLVLVDSSASIAPLSCYATPAKAVAFEKDSSRIFTCHHDAVVQWDGGNGVALAVHRPTFTVPISSCSSGALSSQSPSYSSGANRPKTVLEHSDDGAIGPAAEVLVGMALSPKKHQYFVATSLGRVASVRVSTGQVSSDYGCIRPVEVKAIHVGLLARGAEVVVVLFVDGCVSYLVGGSGGASSGGGTLAHLLDRRPPVIAKGVECLCFANEALGQVALGTTDGRVLFTAVEASGGVATGGGSAPTPNRGNKGLIGVNVSYCPSGGLAPIESLGLIIAALSNGTMAVINAHSATVVRRVRVSASPHVGLTHIATRVSDKGPLHGFNLVVGDALGVVRIMLLRRSILSSEAYVNGGEGAGGGLPEERYPLGMSNLAAASMHPCGGGSVRGVGGNRRPHHVDTLGEEEAIQYEDDVQQHGYVGSGGEGLADGDGGPLQPAHGGGRRGDGVVVLRHTFEALHDVSSASAVPFSSLFSSSPHANGPHAASCGGGIGGAVLTAMAIRDDGHCFVTCASDATARVTRMRDGTDCGLLCHGRRLRKKRAADVTGGEAASVVPTDGAGGGGGGLASTQRGRRPSDKAQGLQSAIDLVVGRGGAAARRTSSNSGLSSTVNTLASTTTTTTTTSNTNGANTANGKQQQRAASIHHSSRAAATAAAVMGGVPPYSCEVGAFAYFRSVQRSLNVLRVIHRFVAKVRARIKQRRAVLLHTSIAGHHNSHPNSSSHSAVALMNASSGAAGADAATVMLMSPVPKSDNRGRGGGGGGMTTMGDILFGGGRGGEGASIIVAGAASAASPIPMAPRCPMLNTSGGVSGGGSVAFMGGGHMNTPLRRPHSAQGLRSPPDTSTHIHNASSSSATPQRRNGAALRSGSVMGWGASPIATMARASPTPPPPPSSSSNTAAAAGTTAPGGTIVGATAAASSPRRPTVSMAAQNSRTMTPSGFLAATSATSVMMTIGKGGEGSAIIHGEGPRGGCGGGSTSFVRSGVVRPASASAGGRTVLGSPQPPSSTARKGGSNSMASNASASVSLRSPRKAVPAASTTKYVEEVAPPYDGGAFQFRPTTASYY